MRQDSTIRSWSGESSYPPYVAESPDLTTFTSTSIGYLISLVLPGLTAIYAASFYSPTVARVLHRLTTTESSFGLFLLILLVSMTISLVLMPASDLAYSKAVNRMWRIRPELTDDQRARLSKADVMQSWRALVDEQFRYFQFWGASSIVFPALIGGIAYRYGKGPGSLATEAILGAFIEGLLVFATIEALRRQSKYEQGILASHEGNSHV